MRLLRWAVTFHLVCFAWIFFRAPDLASSLVVLEKLGSLASAGAVPAPLAALASALLLFVVMHWVGARFALKQRLGDAPLLVHGAATLACLLLLVLFTPQYSAPFIYFQF